MQSLERERLEGLEQEFREDIGKKYEDQRKYLCKRLHSKYPLSCIRRNWDF